MAYTCTLYDSISRVPAEQWESLRQPSDLATDRRLIESFEKTMAGQCRCWTAIVTDDSTNQPAAAACLCLFRVDAVEATGSVIRTMTKWVRRISPRALRFGVLFCGLPVPSGENHLRLRKGVDAPGVMRALDSALRALARDQGARMIVFKEFDDSYAAIFDSLAEAGYGRGAVPSAYVLRADFDSFDGLCARLKAHYRYKIKHSRKLFAQAGFSAQYFYGGEIADAYSDEVHRLYEAVWERATYRLEKLPAEFFREAGPQLGQRASMTLVRGRDNRPAAFVFGLSNGSGTYYNLYGGIDYERPESECDLYFNLHFLDLDQALRRGARTIHLGQTAEEFKARLGAVPTPLYFCARAVNPVLNAGLHAAKSLVFPAVGKAPQRDVFKDEPAQRPKRKAAGRNNIRLEPETLD